MTDNNSTKDTAANVQTDHQKDSAANDQATHSAQNSSSISDNKTDNQTAKNDSDKNQDSSADKNKVADSAKDKGDDQDSKAQSSKDSDNASKSDKKDDAKKSNGQASDQDSDVDDKDKKLLGADMEFIIKEEEKIKEKLKDSIHLERFTTDISLFISLIKDYYQGNYRKIPYKSISSIVIGLVYILNPIDIIPDFIPVIGYVDDALVIAFCLKMVEKDLLEYQAWKEQQGDSDSKDKKQDA